MPLALKIICTIIGFIILPGATEQECLKVITIYDIIFFLQQQLTSWVLIFGPWLIDLKS